MAHSYACSSYVWYSIKLKLLDISDQHVLHMCIKFHVPKLNTHWDIAILWKPLFDFSYTFLNFPLISPARWLESVNTTMAEKRKKEMEVQLFEDSEQDGIALYDDTYHLHVSQKDEI